MMLAMPSPRFSVLVVMMLPIVANVRAATRASAPDERRFTLFYTAEVHGTLEPCGCTSDPLGDVARYASVVRAARKQSGDILLVDAGGLSFPEGGSGSRERAGNELRAAFLETELGKLGLVAPGLADTDIAPGPLHLVTPPRMAVNLKFAAGVKTAPSVLRTIGGIKIGVLGVVDPAVATTALSGRVEDPVVAARREAQRLRTGGAEIVIVLAPVERAVARRIAREARVDFVVCGRQVGAGSPRADVVPHSSDLTPEEKLGLKDDNVRITLSPDIRPDAFLLTPSDELQRVGRLDVVLRGHGPLVPAGSPETATMRKAELARDIADIDANLARWSRQGINSTFVAGMRQRREALVAEQARLTASPSGPPVEGSYFINTLIPLSRSLPRDPAIAAAMHGLDAKIAKVNVANAAPPPPAEPGRPSYVGMDKCASCHKQAAALWRTTVHAHAWKTLVDGGKQADYKCVGCHVTGYGEIGGSSLGYARRLENVQCETCHGPGSAHVGGKGLEEPPAIRRETPASVCTGCHNEHHSDTFNYNAYLRDVLGPGHAASARARLGDGPTGHALRSAALAKATGAQTLEKL